MKFELKQNNKKQIIQISKKKIKLIFQNIKLNSGIKNLSLFSHVVCTAAFWVVLRLKMEQWF